MKKSRIRIFLSIIVIAEILMSSSASTNGLLPATVNQITPAVMPSIPETISATGIDSMQSIEAKISDIFKSKTKKAKLSETYSGTCGDNVNWNLDTSTGVLTISGTGAMTDYHYDENAPWDSYRDSIKTVLIKSGVTSIGDYTFRDYSGLNSVTIPDSVTDIGSFAFEYCSGLTSITIPDSVTSINSYTFSGCSGLTSIIIPNSVSSISSMAFRDCSSLTAVTIGNGVTSMEIWAFSLCSGLTKISVDSNNPYYKSENGVLFNKSGTTLILFPAGKAGSYSVPNSVTEIGYYAFQSCRGLASINIPSSLTKIGNSSFAFCSGLAEVNIPNSVTTISADTFYGCSGLTSVIIPDSITSIGRSAFHSCSTLTSVIIGNGVTTIGDTAFHGCSRLTSITIPNIVTSIGSHAFQHCADLTSVSIPNSVTSIGSSAFAYCSKLASVIYEGTSDPGDLSTDVFYNTKVNYVNVPTDYLNDTFCGKPVSRPTTAAFTARGDYFASLPKQIVSLGAFQLLLR